jgi:hypothetical protein
MQYERSITVDLSYAVAKVMELLANRASVC